ncbi:MAG TPA: tRNA (5-methylaminomethyl-2-thiouridine)(34)-methyltransferase MnmD [Saprospiraceae bacterium]|nr:tRNA (5-methylaminomethyl-2-thiouridine)(34)-methyltransferase MnmD [Saprospiraceae bacterium]HRJ14522.1 tRNA (5-methylaminomethyl-2-thiouridine)(34)-methyltransferase MnmD [Saprospiraceae bacterium]HRK83329.1 tRNA (5-methylaminomethyl-2-thiouridine)(34)-methyltransferase MnmD [Saprospiraceae bacterium]
MDHTSLIETQDGSHSVLSHRFGVTYHSKYGAIQESRHVFIEAGLFPKLILQRELAVLELGFGTGLNAFLTLLEAERLERHIFYQTIEAFPLSQEQAAQLNYPEQLELPASRPWLTEMHAAPSDKLLRPTPHFQFRKTIGRFEELDLQNAFDVAYFDAFAPETQPELWTEEVLGRVYRALRPQGILVTYCAKGAVKRTLKSLGFQIERIPGPPGKREMTRAVKTEAK